MEIRFTAEPRKTHVNDDGMVICDDSHSLGPKLDENMSEYLSNKFRWLSLIATWAVVCIHSRTDRWAIGVEDYATHVESAVGEVFHFAVPMFFVISGYMFARSFRKYGWADFLKRKVRSLYIPLVIWCIVGLAFLLPIKLYSRNDIPNVVDALKSPLMMLPPGLAHFWYVRALFILSIAAPLVMLVVKRIWLCAFMMFVALLIPEGSMCAVLHIPVAVIFFFLGAVMAHNGITLKLSLLRAMFAAVGCLVGLILSFVFRTQISQHYFSILVEPLFMMGFLWFGYDVLDAKIRIVKFPNWLNVLFFVYCMHIITLCWCGGVMRVVLGNGPSMRMMAYFVLWLTFWVDVAIANGVRKLFPKAFAVLAGGR